MVRMHKATFLTDLAAVCFVLIVTVHTQATPTSTYTQGIGATFCRMCGSRTDTGVGTAIVSRCAFIRPGATVDDFVFECQCRGPHFSGDGITCNNVDECALEIDNCSDYSVCTDTLSAFECQCRHGYTGDGIRCTALTTTEVPPTMSTTTSQTTSIESLTTLSNKLSTTGSGLACVTQDVTITLQEGEKSTNVEVAKGKLLRLSAGTYTLTEVSERVNCTIEATTSKANSCPGPINEVASSVTKTAVVNLPIPEKGYKHVLPVGRSTLQIPYGNYVCDVLINVIDGELRRRLVFQADYDVKCVEATAAVTRKIILATAQHHYKQIKELCGKYCKPIVTRQPIIGCSKGKLRIQWPTNPVYSGDVVKIKPDVQSAIMKRLSNRGLSSFTLVIPSKVPPVVYPIKTSTGDAVIFTLVAHCVGNATYSANTDRCL